MVVTVRKENKSGSGLKSDGGGAVLECGQEAAPDRVLSRSERLHQCSLALTFLK